jgi:hypothetical protein
MVTVCAIQYRRRLDTTTGDCPIAALTMEYRAMAPGKPPAAKGTPRAPNTKKPGSSAPPAVSSGCLLACCFCSAGAGSPRRTRDTLSSRFLIAMPGRWSLWPVWYEVRRCWLYEACCWLLLLLLHGSRSRWYCPLPMLCSRTSTLCRNPPPGRHHVPPPLPLSFASVLQVLPPSGSSYGYHLFLPPRPSLGFPFSVPPPFPEPRRLVLFLSVASPTAPTPSFSNLPLARPGPR